ncbi:MAG TPA: sigma-70 family RNA polymerase sigma factor [bacterium]|nr:sigma-70 family RNA polymerase sigma factor [bacterium]HPR86991.1 sigma-70 family RNA polymerase sigma factor [bacterium]
MPNQMIQRTLGRPVQNDQELIAAFQRGEQGAFDVLVRRHEQRIRALIACYISDPHDIQDVAQETFIRAWHALPAYRPQAQFSTWLIRIAINQSLNQLRSCRRRRWLKPFSQLMSGEAEMTAGKQAPVTPLQEVEEAERNRMVQAALEALSEEQRTVVILHRFQGLKYHEIAEVTGSSVAAVEARLHRAKLKLAGLLRTYCDE